MKFEEWWEAYEEHECFFHHSFLTKMAWDYRQKEIDELKKEIKQLEKDYQHVADSLENCIT